ncbi:MAG: amidohydrolase, partial [Bacteroidia bacterium]|nr:amidohydrolase [Bacteroidia bacterium]
ALRYLIRLFGANRIAYGTDYPFPLGDLEHGKFITEMEDLTQETVNQLFWKTAIEFLNLNIEEYQS